MRGFSCGEGNLLAEYEFLMAPMTLSTLPQDILFRCGALPGLGAFIISGRRAVARPVRAFPGAAAGRGPADRLRHSKARLPEGV